MFRASLCIFLLFTSAQAYAAPGSGELLKACERSLKNGFQGIEGQMCTWYVRPCECDPEKPGKPNVCLSEGLSTEDLARKVVSGLKAEPALLELEADVAAARVLVRDYPCP